MKELKDFTREEYDIMKKSGMMGEIFPESTWNYETDMDTLLDVSVENLNKKKNV